MFSLDLAEYDTTRFTKLVEYKIHGSVVKLKDAFL